MRNQEKQPVIEVKDIRRLVICPADETRTESAVWLSAHPREGVYRIGVVLLGEGVQPFDRGPLIVCESASYRELKRIWKRETGGGHLDRRFVQLLGPSTRQGGYC